MPWKVDDQNWGVIAFEGRFTTGSSTVPAQVILSRLGNWYSLTCQNPAVRADYWFSGYGAKIIADLYGRFAAQCQNSDVSVEVLIIRDQNVSPQLVNSLFGKR